MSGFTDIILATQANQAAAILETVELKDESSQGLKQLLDCLKSFTYVVSLPLVFSASGLEPHCPPFCFVPAHYRHQPPRLLCLAPRVSRPSRSQPRPMPCSKNPLFCNREATRSLPSDILVDVHHGHAHHLIACRWTRSDLSNDHSHRPYRPIQDPLDLETGKVRFFFLSLITAADLVVRTLSCSQSAAERRINSQHPTPSRSTRGLRTLDGWILCLGGHPVARGVCGFVRVRRFGREGHPGRWAPSPLTYRMCIGIVTLWSRVRQRPAKQGSDQDERSKCTPVSCVAGAADLPASRSVSSPPNHTLPYAIFCPTATGTIAASIPSEPASPTGHIEYMCVLG